ncbi:hypothetical protein NLU13_8638 [Sarocladium strictum]|uniref:Uncharacterized protein n=1 Tax=Sarocladium strictum TaxID=5046 RepID=A0AA39GEG0_SARSR|nr:hypothetical protein NLU13_8638 [Sarocladium strictum]
MLAFLLVPVLRRTSVRFGKETVVTFTGSFVHWLTAFPERRSRHIILDLADRKAARMTDRYNVSKLIHLLLTREFAKALDASPQPGTVTTSHANPGHVKTGILRHTPLLFQAVLVPWQKLTARARPSKAGGSWHTRLRVAETRMASI